MSRDDVLSRLKGISDKDRRQIEQAQEMLGPEAVARGFVKSLFWGKVRGDLLLPYPEVDAAERLRCDALLARLDSYLENEHPAAQIDQEQEIPRWVVDRLFALGVMGMIIPREYGGGGYSVTSYCRVLERIARTCGSTAVIVSAHQSIGCGAIIFFGSEAQKRRWLPAMATDTLSAFCLSEPNVGSDAAGQETRCELTPDGRAYVLNGEKKWSTSGALAGLMTVMARQRLRDPETGEEKQAVTALIVTPDMAGVEIFDRNRAKCGIRGSWQARIRFNGVKVPRENLLHHEGRGLQVALSCLNIGRCTLSAGAAGPAKKAWEQATKWAQYRYQFGCPLADFELVQDKLATMAALCYAMDSMLHVTAGMVDRHDDDIMVETAACKVFCSEMSHRVIDQAMQVMGGEGYMAENEVERMWRDSRINLIVEGANEVMHAFIFGYGSKQLGEHLLALRGQPFAHLGEVVNLAGELVLGLRRPRPRLEGLHPLLLDLGWRLEGEVQRFSHRVLKTFWRHKEKLVGRQLVQARLAQSAMWLHAVAATLARADRSARSGTTGQALEDELGIVRHICALAWRELGRLARELDANADATVADAVSASIRHAESLPNGDYAIPERTPDESARGTGKAPDRRQIRQFGAGSLAHERMPQRKAG